MKQAVRAIVTFAFGVSLAAAAQAAPGTSSPPDMPSTPPSATMQSTAPGTNPLAAAPRQMGEATAGHHLARSDIKQAQQELQSQGLYRGRIDGIVGHQTRAAVAAFQQHNGLHRTARLDQDTLSRLTSGQTPAAGSGAGSGVESGVGSGSSNPPTTVLKGTPSDRDASPMTPPAIPAPKEK